MKKLRQIFADGIALLVPLGIAGYILYKILEVLRKFVTPIADILDIHRFFGRFTLVLLSLIALVILILLLGLLMQSKFITVLRDRLESIMLRLFPPLNEVKVFFADQLKRQNATAGWVPIVLKKGDDYHFAYLVEESDKIGVFFILKKNSVSEGDLDIVEKGSYVYTVVDSNDLHMSVRSFGKDAAQLVEKSFSIKDQDRSD